MEARTDHLKKLHKIGLVDKNVRDIKGEEATCTEAWPSAEVLRPGAAPPTGSVRGQADPVDSLLLVLFLLLIFFLLFLLKISYISARSHYQLK
jgi:hypothetical protein